MESYSNKNPLFLNYDLNRSRYKTFSVVYLVLYYYSTISGKPLLKINSFIHYFMFIGTTFIIYGHISMFKSFFLLGRFLLLLSLSANGVFVLKLKCKIYLFQINSNPISFYLFRRFFHLYKIICFNSSLYKVVRFLGCPLKPLNLLSSPF